MKLVRLVRTANTARLAVWLIALWKLFKHPDTPRPAKLVALLVLGYALSPIDLIPDFVPVVGLLDDIILLPLAIALVLKMIPEAVIAECRARAVTDETDRSRIGRFGAIGVALLWLALLILAAIWAYPVFAMTPEDAAPPVAADEPSSGRR